MTRKDPKMDWCQERQIEIPRARTWHLRRFSAETSGCVTSRWHDRTMIWHDCRHDGTNVTSVFVYHLATTGPRRTVFAGFLEELWFFLFTLEASKMAPESLSMATPSNTRSSAICICMHLHSLFEGDPCISDHGAEVTHSCWEMARVATCRVTTCRARMLIWSNMLAEEQ